MICVVLLMIMIAVFSMSRPPPNSASNLQSPAPNLKH
jgi:hypothetical protein